MIEKTIEIDCAPFTPRPDAYIGDVVKGTALERHLKEPVSKLFGCWTWVFDGVSDEDWRAAQAVTRPRIESLYHCGVIRYGSW